MTERDGIRASASLHAARRAIGRLPCLSGAKTFEASRFIEERVVEALAAGRVAKRCPAWCNREHRTGFQRRSRATGASHLRFVWDEAQTAAYLVLRTHDRNDRSKRVWLVVTVVSPAAPA